MSHPWGPSDLALQAFRDGDLPEARQVAVASHLRSCDHCAARLRGMADADVALAAACPRPQPLPPDAAEALFRRALSEARRRPPLFGWRRRLLACGAASLAAVALAAGWHVTGTGSGGSAGPFKGGGAGVATLVASGPAPAPSTAGWMPVALEPRPVSAHRSSHRHRSSWHRWRAAGRLRRHAPAGAPAAPTVTRPAAGGGQMVVMVSEPEPLSVQVRDAAGTTPGYACASALRPDVSGRMTWAQATVSSGAEGSVLVVQPVEDESQ